MTRSGLCPGSPAVASVGGGVWFGWRHHTRVARIVRAPGPSRPSPVLFAAAKELLARRSAEPLYVRSARVRATADQHRQWIV